MGNLISYFIDESEKDKEIQRLKALLVEKECDKDGDKKNVLNNNISISNEQILSWVEDELKDPESNITMMPDYMEKKLKMQIFTILLRMLEKVLSTTKVSFINHELYFKIQPKD